MQHFLTGAFLIAIFCGGCGHNAEDEQRERRKVTIINAGSTFENLRDIHGSNPQSKDEIIEFLRQHGGDLAEPTIRRIVADEIVFHWDGGVGSVIAYEKQALQDEGWVYIVRSLQERLRSLPGPGPLDEAAIKRHQESASWQWIDSQELRARLGM